MNDKAEYMKAFRLSHREEIAEYNRAYRKRKIELQRIRRANNPGQAAAQQRAWREANPERRKQAVEYSMSYYRTHREERAAYDIAYHEARRERFAAYRAARRKAHPELMAELDRKQNSVRRARLRNAVIEHVIPSVVWGRDKGVCHICNEPAGIKDWHLDHVIPLSRGGAHAYMNVAVSHPRCNQQKSAKLVQLVEAELVNF